MDEDMINLMAMDLWAKVYAEWCVKGGNGVACTQADVAVEEFRKRFKP